MNKLDSGNKFDLLDDKDRVWRSARTLSFLLATVSVVSIVGWYLKQGSSYWQWYLAALTTIFFSVIVNRYRDMPSWVCSTIFLITAAIGLFASTLTSYELATNGVKAVAFAGCKLLPIATAIIAPSPVWIGFLVISVSGVVPVFLYYFAYSLPVREALAIQEPWYTLIYAVVAFFVLRHRLKGIQLERTMSRLKAERRAIDDLARIFLGLRDLTNTPLQSIELTARLLKTGHLTGLEGSMHLDQSLIRLRELSQVLSSYEKDVNWDRMPTSFNAVALLEEKLGEKG